MSIEEITLVLNSFTAMVADMQPFIFELPKKLISSPIFVPSASQG
jgi:hypothetical protein